MKYRPSLDQIEVALIGIVALLLLVLSLYHLTHEGLPSGVMEMASFLMLVTAAIIALRSSAR